VRAPLLAVAALLAGCATHGGGYYKGDGPGGPPPVDLDRVADAKPRVEPLNPGANTPYTALGRKYTPYTALTPYRARGVATWYGRAFQGKRTASGERYDMYAMTAAHTISAKVEVEAILPGRNAGLGGMEREGPV
jgi:rare lipoprotein A